MGVADPAGDDAHWESGVAWRRMFAVFWRIGILSFGGPAAQIALMHRVLVEEEKWLDEPRFLGALSFCMLLPGPEAMQLATYAGWQLRGVPGGLLAGLLFVVPGALVVLGLAMLYMAVGHLPVMAALFLGIKGAVLIVVLEALLKVSKRALHSAVHWIIAGLAFVAIFFLSVPFPVLILAAGLAGFFLLGGQSAEKTGTVRGGGSLSRHGEDGGDMDGRLVDAGVSADGSGRLRHSGAGRQFLLPPRGGHVRRSLRGARLPGAGRGDL